MLYQQLIDQYGPLTFVKAKKSGGNNSNGCVEVAYLPDGSVVVRDSKDPFGPVLIFTAHEFECFADGAGKGEFSRT